MPVKRHLEESTGSTGALSGDSAASQCARVLAPSAEPEGCPEPTNPAGVHAALEVEAAVEEEWSDDDEPVSPPTGTLCPPRPVKPLADMTEEEMREYGDAVLAFAEAWGAV